MFIQFNIRRRPSLDESIPEFNEYLTQRFCQLADFWGVGKTGSDAPMESSANGESHGLDLRRVLRHGLAGQLNYCPRLAGYVSRDYGASDDYIDFGLDTDKVDYASFCRETLPEIINIFRPYRADISTNHDVRMADYEITQRMFQETRRNTSGRDLMYRIWPVSYMDDVLCQRSFGIGADEVVRRAAPECEQATLLCGGAFLIVTSEIIVDEDALNALDGRIKSCLID